MSQEQTGTPLNNALEPTRLRRVALNKRKGINYE
jgi:hypothetical protein